MTNHHHGPQRSNSTAKATAQESTTPAQTLVVAEASTAYMSSSYRRECALADSECTRREETLPDDLDELEALLAREREEVADKVRRNIELIKAPISPTVSSQGLIAIGDAIKQFDQAVR